MDANKYGILTPTLLEKLIAIVGADHVSQEAEQLTRYGQDETEDLIYQPDVVVKPQTVAQVSAIARLCNENKIPLTTRGAGTGLSGGALPLSKGVLLSMEKFNRIIEVDERNLQATI